LVAPLALRVTELPTQIVDVFGVTVNVIGGFMPTTKEAVDVPQAFTAETEIVPAAAPKLTVIAFELVGVDVIVALGGTDHV